MNVFPNGFQRYRVRAAALLSSPQTTMMLLRRAGTALDRRSLTESMEAVKTDLTTCMQLVRAWVRGEYGGITTSSLVLIVAAILYFVAPLDAVPDVIPMGGYLDDAALVSLVASQVRNELKAFRIWQRASGTHSRN